MTSLKWIGVGATMLVGVSLVAPPAQAAYIVTLLQAGSNVVATGSGTIDTAGLSPAGSSSATAGIVPSFGGIVTGPASGALTDEYTGVTGPASFGSGSGSGTRASSGSGDIVGIFGSVNELAVPAGYSGASLLDSSTYDNTTLAGLGVTPGTYVYRLETRTGTRSRSRSETPRCRNLQALP